MIWKNTFPTELTSKDSVDVHVRYRYVVAARMLYKDYCGVSKVANQQLYTIQQQDLEIKDIKKSNQSLLNVNHYNDSIHLNDSTLLFNAQIQHSKDAWELRGQKATKWGLGISLPVAAALSFILGWYLHIK